MKVASFKPASQYKANAPKQPKPEENKNPKPADDGNGDTPPDTMAQQIVKDLTSSPEFTKRAMNIGRNQELTIQVNDADVIKIRNEGPSLTQRFLDGTNKIFTSATSEAARIVEADPAFAFKNAALGVRQQVESGLPREAASTLNDAFLPMLRVAMLALDSKKAIDTFKNKDSSLLDRGVDAGHVVTDVAGLVGALGKSYFGMNEQLANTLTAVGLAGDVLAYSIHVLAYLKERGQVNLVENSELKPPTNPPSPPNPPQGPPEA